MLHSARTVYFVTSRAAVFSQLHRDDLLFKAAHSEDMRGLDMVDLQLER